MSAPVPVGSIITYTSGDWYSGWFTGTNDLTNQVGTALIAQGLTIRKVNSASVNGAVGTIDKYLGGPATLTISLDVEVTGGSGFGSVNDVASIVNHEVYQATGHLPVISSTPAV